MLDHVNACSWYIKENIKGKLQYNMLRMIKQTIRETDTYTYGNKLQLRHIKQKK